MNTDSDVLALIMAFLTLLSIFSWTVLITKSFVLWREKKRSEHYFKKIWLPQNWSAIRGYTDKCGMADLSQLVNEGVAVFELLQQQQTDPPVDYKRGELIEKALQQKIQLLMRNKESWVAALASIAAISPLIGLFGTVWGIMNALIAISETGNATLQAVAGPIGEALISTAAGILVAIPAVLAYNYLLRKLRLHHSRLDAYAEQVCRQLQFSRQFNKRSNCDGTKAY